MLANKYGTRTTDGTLVRFSVARKKLNIEAIIIISNNYQQFSNNTSISSLLCIIIII